MVSRVVWLSLVTLFWMIVAAAVVWEVTGVGALGFAAGVLVLVAVVVLAARQ